MNEMSPKHCRQHGFSLVELMIAMALGLVILGAMTVLFVNNSKTRQALEKTSRQLENGRYAIQLMADDVRLAGFLGTYVPPLSAPSLAAVPDPCVPANMTLSAIDGARLLHVQGYDNGLNAPSCLTDLKPNTDILVVRRASSCAIGESGCDSFADHNHAPHFQASNCSTDTSPYLMDTVAANFTLKKVDCTTTAEVRRYFTHIYFIAKDNIGTDGIPTLKRAELSVDASNNIGWVIVPLVEGIENLQLEYGLDTKTSSACTATSPAYTAPCDDGSPDTFSIPASVTDWWNVVLVRISILARDTEPTTGYVDSKSYTLGSQPIAAPMDAYRRHAYSTNVRLSNVAGRRE